MIVGGESGPRRATNESGSGRSIFATSASPRASPFFFKQWGGRSPKTGGRLLEGKEWNQFPKTRSHGRASLNCGPARDRPPFKFDEIGDWSELKLDIVEKYGAAYTKAFNKRAQRLKKYYIDGFSGAGVHVVKANAAQRSRAARRAR